MSLIKTNKTFTFVSNPEQFLKKDIMISATRLSSGTREFIWSLKHRPKFSKEIQEKLKKGTENHEKHQEGIKTIDEYGYIEFRKDLYQNKKIKLKELKVVSPNNALYGIVDIVEIQYDENKNLNIWINELKSGYMSKYFTQLMAYVFMLSDTNTKLVYQVPLKSGNVRRETGFLYPSPSDINKVNIYGKIQIMWQKEKPFQVIVKDNEFLDGLKDLVLGLKMKLFKFQQIMRDKVIDISQVPHDEYCCKGAYKHLCDKHPYTPKSKQYYFGKKTTLIKSKPLRI